MLRNWLPLLGAALALALIGHTSRTHAFRHHLQTQRYQDLYYLPPPDWLRVATAGYSEAAADLVWVAMIANFGKELVRRGQARHIFQYGDAVIALDPYLKRAYTWVGTVSLYRLRQATVADAKKAAGYLEAAAKLFPDDGELMWLLGAHYSYEMPPLLPNDAEARAEAKRKGREFLQAAALLGAGPPWLGLVAASGLESLGEKERTIRYLSEIYMTIDDPNAKREIAQRLMRLKNASFIEAMGRAEIKLRQQKMAHFPYLDETLFLLVGPRPPFDEVDQLKRYFDPVEMRASEANP